MNENSIRIAVKSPEYLPRLSYVALMQSVDVFVLADTFQYSRQSYQNRAKIRTPQGWQWMSVPLEGRQHGRPIQKTIIDNRSHWRSKHLRAFSFNYSQSPYSDFLVDAMHDLLSRPWELLADFTCQSVSLIHEMLQLRCRLIRASTLVGCPGSVQKILEMTDANVLVTDIPAKEKMVVPMSKEGLVFQEPAYRQHFEGFEPNMSAIDLICNYGPEAYGIVRDGVSLSEH